MPPNARRATLADIAQAAGVSVATVSKVVNGRGDVAAQTRARVQELLYRHDYLAPVFRHTEALESPIIEVQFQGEVKSYVAQALEGSDATKAPPFSWPGALVAAHRARSEDARRSVAGGRPRSATDSTARGSDI